jgi:hypothetical protein
VLCFWLGLVERRNSSHLRSRSDVVGRFGCRMISCAELGGSSAELIESLCRPVRR